MRLTNWLARLRLQHHARKHGSRVQIEGQVDYVSLDFDLHQHAHWFAAQGSKLGKDSVIALGEHAQFSMGEDSKMGRRSTIKMLDAQQGARVSLGARCRLEDDVKCITFGAGKLSIADDCFIGWGSVLSAQDTVSIGQGTAIAEYVSIRDHNHEQGGAEAVHLSAMKVQAVHIGCHVWIGAKVTIVAGVTIGDNAVIGANAVVTKNVAAGAKVVGVPARPIG